MFLPWHHFISAFRGEFSPVSCSWGTPALSLLTHLGTRPRCWARQQPEHPFWLTWHRGAVQVMSNIPPDGPSSLGDTVRAPHATPEPALPAPHGWGSFWGLLHSPIPNLPLDQLDPALSALHSPGPSLGLFSSPANRKVSSACVSLGPCCLQPCPCFLHGCSLIFCRKSGLMG